MRGMSFLETTKLKLIPYMKTNIIRYLLCSVLALTFAATAEAGPGPTQFYKPVTTLQEAEAIKPGTRIAVRCGYCGAINTMVANADRSYLHEFTCPACKHKFVLRSNGHGGSNGAYVCEDDSGHRATLLQAL